VSSASRGTKTTSLRFRFLPPLGRNQGSLASLQVRPRPTPEEYDDLLLNVEVDEDFAVLAATLEDWVGPRAGWELMLCEGTDFGRHNNVEAELLSALGEQTSRLAFRLDQLEAADDAAQQLVLRFEERDGIAKLARLNERGLDVELFHILTFT
jgi:hypothetical protein